MEVFKLLHKPTGLYFTPSKSNGNLSINGKIYPRKPSIKWVSTIRIILRSIKRDDKLRAAIKTHFSIPDGYFDKYFTTSESEWEVIEL